MRSVRFYQAMFCICLFFLPGVSPGLAGTQDEIKEDRGFQKDPKSPAVSVSNQSLQGLKIRPSFFVPNTTGRTGKRMVDNSEVIAFVQSQQGRVMFTPSGAFISMATSGDESPRDREVIAAAKNKPQGFSVRTEVRQPVVMGVGFATERAKKRGLLPRLEEQAQGTVNYFVGAKRNWRSGIPTYRKLVYDDVWDGITLEYLGYMDRLEYRLLLEAGSDPAVIVMETGAEHMRIDPEGALVARLGMGELRLQKPFAFQIIDEQEFVVGVAYEVLENGRFGFQLGVYDKRYPLVIDPVLSWSSYLGSSGDDRGGAVAVDSAENVYVAGFTNSSGFPTTTGAYDETHNAGYDVYVTKLISAGTALGYSTFIGGSGQDYQDDVAVDAAGIVTVVGFTESSDFPTTTGAFDETHNGLRDFFVTRLNSSGTGLIYSTFLGSAGQDTNGRITLDAAGNTYITGQTQGADFPTTSGAYDETFNGVADSFVTKLNSSGTGLIYSTFIGGTDNDSGTGVGLDAAGNAYVSGWANSTDFPTTPGAYDETKNHVASGTVTVTKLNSTGASLVYSTYIGGSVAEQALGIAVDASGNATIAGWTDSSDYPTTTGAYDETHNGNGDGIVTRLNSTGTGLIFSSFIGSTASEGFRDVAIDATGKVYVTGNTDGSDYPVTSGAFDETYSGGAQDSMLTVMNSTGTGLDYSTFIGSSGAELGLGIAVAASGNVYITGYTDGSDFTTTSGVYDETANGGNEAFVTMIPLCGGAVISSDPIAAVKCLGESVTFSVTTTGSAPITYQWKKEGVDIAGATATDYTIASVSAGDAANYTCEVTNACGSDTSNPASLTVRDPVIITSQPNGADKCTGESVTFSVTASGTATLTYQWKKDGVDIGGATTTSYTIATTVSGDAGNYTCAVTNDCGVETTNVASLIVRDPISISAHPSTGVGCIGTSHTFSVTATGTAPSYQWRYYGENIPGATSSSYTIAAVISFDAGDYDCVVSDSCSSATSNVASLSLSSGVAFNGHPNSASRCLGESVSFSVSAIGSGLTYQWTLDGVAISGATGTSAASYRILWLDPQFKVTSSWPHGDF